MDKAATAASSASSFQTIAVLVLFIAVMAALPWLLRRWQQRQLMARGVQTQVLSAVALSPGQRIVVVEVGQGGQRTRLVLGVTAQNIHCLHVLGSTAPAGTVDAGAAASAASFAGALEQSQHASGQPSGTHP